MLTFLVNEGDAGYRMYDEDALLLEDTFKPVVPLTEKQVGLYEREDIPGGGYVYVFRMRAYFEEAFNEGDYLSLFDYLTDFYYNNTEDDDEE